ncbi:hypothetical protein [Tahibacter sp.]|uniref:hypothetical protein n=1 Tax=Tahibacter sp. TaxID=2056211 RepID=UPI0028C38DFD|nr:hypothetical protein [Tahibacter sp.]
MRGPALLGALLATSVASADVVPQIAALLRDARLGEISGMALSTRTPQRLWLHNDSGTRPELFALDTDGRLQARLVLSGSKPVDWEDMAAFELDGKSYLLIADTGDNGAVRKRSELLIVEEPAFDDGGGEKPLTASPAWRIGFRYADAPHDVEAVAIDALSETVLLLTKRTSPPQIWSLPLRPGNRTDLVAQPVGSLAVPQEAVPAVNFERRLQPGRPTGFAISRDGRSAAVLTYASVWLYRRADGERWTQALGRTPQVFPFGLLAQAEAIAIDATGARVFVSGERWPAPLLRLDLPPIPTTP